MKRPKSQIGRKRKRAGTRPTPTRRRAGPVRRETEKARIGIIGRGNVGTALAKGLRRSGHELRAVGKEPQRVEETTRWADLVILAVPYAERENALAEMGEAAHGKIIVDVTNALAEDGSFAGDAGHSGAEELQEKAKGAKIVKAFNTVFAQNMSEGRANGQKLTLLVAGDESEAKERVIALGSDLGFDAVDVGPLKNARSLEALGYLNIQLGYEQGMGTDIGFRLVH